MIVEQKLQNSTKRSPPPQERKNKELHIFSKRANDNTTTITWLQLCYRFLIFAIVLVLCSSTDQYLIKDQYHMKTLISNIQKKENIITLLKLLWTDIFWGSVSREFPVERGLVVERPTFVEELSTCLFNSHCWSYLAGEGEETLITQLIPRVLQQRIITTGYHSQWNPIYFKVPNFVTRVS